MRVTVCELEDEPGGLERDWERLVDHARRASPDLIVLPEMGFSRWFAVEKGGDPAVWDAAVAAHEAWLERLGDLAPATAVASRPLETGGRRVNEGFVWDQDRGYRAAHHKYYLPEEEGYWEASWYERGDGRFEVIDAAGATIGFQICTDMWFTEHARAYGRAGAHIIACPRVTERSTVEKWVVGGRAAAIVSGAYHLSSNKTPDGRAKDFGGWGWVIDPDGEVVAFTTPEEPFVTVDIDLERAERAKSTYPRYVRE